MDTLTAIGTLILALTMVVLAYFTYWRGKQAVKIAGEDRERDDREDRDARQVIVIEEGVNQINRTGPNRRIILSSPNISPVKQVQGAIVNIRPGGGLNITPFGGHAPPTVDTERTCRSTAEASSPTAVGDRPRVEPQIPRGPCHWRPLLLSAFSISPRPGKEGRVTARGHRPAELRTA